MKNAVKFRLVVVAVVVAAVVAFGIFRTYPLNANDTGGAPMGESLQLPEPETEGEVPLEHTIAGRRRRRTFTDRTLTLKEVGQVLWSAQGVTDEARGYRAAPSAGATYPLKIYIAAGDGAVEGLNAGVYLYDPEDHSLSQTLEGDVRRRLARAALGQGFVGDAPVSVVITADYDRTTGRYGERGIRYVHMEVGHAGGNIYLQCEALGLGTVAVGAFDDGGVEDVMGIPRGEDALYIMPVGYVR